METTNTNGYTIDDTLHFLNCKNSPCYLPVQYSKPNTDYTFDSMAPRTVYVPIINTTTHSTLPTAIRPAFEAFLCSSSSKPAMEKSVLPNFQCDVYDILTIESAEQKLQNLASRRDVAERRSLRVKSKIARLRSHSHYINNLEENVSDVTESSSEDEACGISEQLEHVIRDRAAIRSHFFTLQSEKTIAEDCLQNLRIARQWCKKLRRSYPLFFIEKNVDAASRTLPYEKPDKPRHTYHNMSLATLDFKFSGSARPTRISHPHCDQADALSCIFCCPAFERKSKERVDPADSDITEKSLAVDKPKCQTPIVDDIGMPRRNFLSTGHTLKSRPRDMHHSGSSGVSSSGSQDDFDRRHQSSLPRSGNPRFFPNNKAPFSVDRKRNFDFSSTATPRNQCFLRTPKDTDSIPQIPWRKVLYPSSAESDRNKVLRKSQLTTQNSQSVYKYREHSLNHQFENAPVGNFGKLQSEEATKRRKRRLSSTIPKLLHPSKRSRQP
ncbi:hypothetical protein Aperf_G00000067500 [Anoplocephala perfoliata]